MKMYVKEMASPNMELIMDEILLAHTALGAIDGIIDVSAHKVSVHALAIFVDSAHWEGKGSNGVIYNRPYYTRTAINTNLKRRETVEESNR